MNELSTRYGARMSQAFTATEPSITLSVEDEIIVDDDIEYNGQLFTDGIGDISLSMAKKIVRKLEERPGNKRRFHVLPSAFQFRLGGFKGVLAINYKLKGSDIVLRKSQQKFHCACFPHRLLRQCLTLVSTADSLEIEIAQSFWKPSK